MISPTGHGIRRPDKWGRGEYGVTRGKKRHEGGDYTCDPGQDIIAPIDGIIVRVARPYRKGKYSGVLLQGKHMTLKLFYLKPDRSVIRASVRQGERIGTAQDISEKYPGMTPHIHLRIVSMDPGVLTEML
jgi:hypothetical protein